MTISETEIREKLLKAIASRGPIGWYALEHSLPIEPREYPDGKNMMTYLRALCEDGLLSGTEQTKYTITEAGCRALGRR